MGPWEKYTKFTMATWSSRKLPPSSSPSNACVKNPGSPRLPMEKRPPLAIIDIEKNIELFIQIEKNWDPDYLYPHDTTILMVKCLFLMGEMSQKSRSESRTRLGQIHLRVSANAAIAPEPGGSWDPKMDGL